jgi:F-type H+-transporting ATPase subunit epsilon
MAQTMLLEIVTPDGKTYSGEVEMVVLPTVEGEIGVYPNHAPLVTQLKPGEALIQAEGRLVYGALGEGFAEITPGRVSVMTDMAVRADKIDEAAAEEALQRAQKRLKEKLSEEEVSATNAALMNSLAQLGVKRRHRH